MVLTRHGVPRVGSCTELLHEACAQVNDQLCRSSLVYLILACKVSLVFLNTSSMCMK